MLCQGTGPACQKARTMQQKMGKTRVHVESRIKAITDILAPPTAAVPSAPSSGPRPPRPAQPPVSAAAAPAAASAPGTQPQPPAPERPPSYEEATLPPPSYRQSCADTEAGAGARLPRSQTSDSVTSGEQGEVLFSMGEVQVFHVSPGGEVTTPSYPETLHVVRLERARDKSGAELPPAFLEVGEWTYPLLRGKSPIMKSSYGSHDTYYITLSQSLK